MGIDKIAVIGKGLFLIRFTTVENCQKIINGDPQFFDSKPLIVKLWNLDMEILKEDIKTVPIWIRLSNLDIKYWGERTTFKISGLIGTPIKMDQATKKGKN